MGDDGPSPRMDNLSTGVALFGLQRERQRGQDQNGKEQGFHGVYLAKIEPMLAPVPGRLNRFAKSQGLCHSR